MQAQIFAVLDLKSASYGVPFFQVSRGSAQRALQYQLSSNPKDMMAIYPNDFVLYDLGTYDDVTGIISPLSVPAMVISVGDLLTNSKGETNEQQP